jgi:site-specific recombinase XerD
MTVHRGVHHLASVQLEDLEAFREWLPTRAEYEGKTIKMGASTVNRLLRVIKHFFKRHIQWRNLEENPCTYLEFLEAEENERRPMTRIEYELAFEKVPDWYRPILRFIYLTGAPPSCVARLTIADLNFNTRTFSLRRKKGAKAKWKVIHLPMTEEVFALFKEIRNGSSVLDESVFKDNRGCPLRADRISKVGNQAIRAAGLKGVTLYCLRHALAVELTEAHVPTELVRQAMGHASISTTQRYARGVRPQSIAHALQLVRGGNLVAEPKNDLRIKGGEKSS